VLTWGVVGLPGYLQTSHPYLTNEVDLETNGEFD